MDVHLWLLTSSPFQSFGRFDSRLLARLNLAILNHKENHLSSEKKD